MFVILLKEYLRNILYCQFLLIENFMYRLPRYITPPLLHTHCVTIENLVSTRWTPMGQGALVWSVPFTSDLASNI